MKIRKQNIRKWMIKIAAILIVLFMVLTGFVVILWK